MRGEHRSERHDSSDHVRDESQKPANRPRSVREILGLTLYFHGQGRVGRQRVLEVVERVRPLESHGHTAERIAATKCRNKRVSIRQISDSCESPPLSRYPRPARANLRQPNLIAAMRDAGCAGRRPSDDDFVHCRNEHSAFDELHFGSQRKNFRSDAAQRRHRIASRAPIDQRERQALRQRRSAYRRRSSELQAHRGPSWRELAEGRCPASTSGTRVAQDDDVVRTCSS